MNLTAILAQLFKPGALTSEYAAFKSMSTMGKVAAVISFIVFILGLVPEVFGASSKIAITCGAIGSALGVIIAALAGFHYQAGRANLKANAGNILATLVTALQGLQPVLAAIPVAAAPVAAVPVPAAPLPSSLPLQTSAPAKQS